MPDTRLHRGKAPGDDHLFAPEMLDLLGRATADLSLLLSRGYAENSTLKLVGDRYGLTARQRVAVARCACSDQQLAGRKKTEYPIESIQNQILLLDGYNILITLESALSGGYIFRGRDGCIRDLAGIHGTYRKVTETIPALEIIRHVLDGLRIQKAVWYLDSPVSNSGRLKTMIRTLFQSSPFENEVELVLNPDKVLAAADQCIATSDSAILDHCRRWLNLASYLLEYLRQRDISFEWIDLSQT
ncbi:MAG: DUF434 domain-containing protein [Anaerohalosphaeraceae bacterium]